MVFLLLVLQLQIVAGFSPLAAGTALLPVTAIMLVFSARAGALAGRIGPRLPMTVGPLVSAAGLLLLLRVDADDVVAASTCCPRCSCSAPGWRSPSPRSPRPCSTPPRTGTPARRPG